MPKDILTSIHGREVGLDSDRNLVVGGKQITNISAEVGAKNGSTVVETTVIDNGIFRKVKLTCTATPITMTDESGVVLWGGTKVFDFPAGLLSFMGASLIGSVAWTTGNVTALYEGDVGLGTTIATNDATLATTEQNLLETTATAAATAKVGPINAASAPALYTESANSIIDGRTTAADMYLNLLVDENAANDDDIALFTGTIEFIYAIIGSVDPA